MKTHGKPAAKKTGTTNSAFQHPTRKPKLSGVDMQIDQIIKALEEITDRDTDPDTFIYDFLRAFNISKSTITRAKEGGDRNMTKIEGALLLSDKLFFSPVTPDLGGTRTLEEALAGYLSNKVIAKKKPRFYVVTDYTRLLAFDSKEAVYSDIAIKDLAGEYVFFLPLAGMSATKIHEEAEADTKAADRMAKLYDQIVADNPPADDKDRHALNLFLTRLLFCYFAEDTSIFEKRQFTASVETYTKPDGSDVSEHIGRIFETLSLAPTKRKGLPPHLNDFKYVNGGLFNDAPGKRSPVPQFNTRSRTTLIALGNQTWAEINPDIFGSMFQGVIDEGKRGSLGMHYTSVPNIMKVIEPLFLNDLREQFQKAKGSVTRLNKLLHRIYNIRIFDPACGSGNFLIIAYKELRKLEMEVFHELDRVEKRHSAVSPFADSQASFEESGFRGPNEQPPLAIAQSTLRLPGIHVSQFFGIEIDDFASEVAILAMWLAEHQMNVAFKASFGHAPASLPLKDGAKIVCDNSLRIDWKKVCPTDNEHEVFVLGNPPYLGARNQSKEQKADVVHLAGHIKDHKNLDYIGCFFLKAAAYISGPKVQTAFVSTNSVCQGEHVSLLWPNILNKNIQIGFAHTSFKWANNAKAKAGVTCVIVGLRFRSRNPKYIYTGGLAKLVTNISPYLVDGPTRYVTSRKNGPLSSIPSVRFGNMPNNGDAFFLDAREYAEIIQHYPKAESFIRKSTGTREFIDGIGRWCLWIEDRDYSQAMAIPPIAARIARVKEDRLKSKDEGARKLADKAHQFRDRTTGLQPALLIPGATSERRFYIPLGWIPPETIITNLAHVVYDAPLYLFAVLSSRMHMAWVKAVAGRLEERIRYSSAICYNNFPFPEITEARKTELEKMAEAVLAAREEHPEKTISQLYDPDKMPANLREAHQALDLAVEKCYRKTPFPLDGDDERLEYLFKLYEKMTAGESGDTEETPEMDLEDA